VKATMQIDTAGEECTVKTSHWMELQRTMRKINTGVVYVLSECSVVLQCLTCCTVHIEGCADG